MKQILMMAGAMAALAALADPKVTAVTVAPVEGSSGTVAVDYTLDAPAVVTVEFFNDGVSLGGTVVEDVVGDVWKKVDAGPHRIEFDSARALGNVDVDAGKFSAKVTAWPLTNPPDYLVADMGMKSGPESVRYYPAESYLPGGIGDRRYRSHKMLMRKIMAKDVVWTMGSLDVPIGWGVTEPRPNETPHEAQLDHNYYIGVFEVTVGQWQLMLCNFVTTGTIPLGAEQNPDMDKPVSSPTYHQIRECPMKDFNSVIGGQWPNPPYERSFLGLLRTATGLDFDLPSEAEWEYAAKATHGQGEMGIVGGTYSAATVGLMGWFSGNENFIHPVGMKPANDWGLYDVVGNLSEWCLDWANTTKEDGGAWGSPTDITQLRGGVNIDRDHPEKCSDGTTGSCRIHRGGNHTLPYTMCGHFYRDYYMPASTLSWCGFRVACPALAK